MLMLKLGVRPRPGRGDSRPIIAGAGELPRRARVALPVLPPVGWFIAVAVLAFVGGWVEALKGDFPA